MPARSLKAVVLLVAVALVPAASAQAAITVSNTGDSGPGSLRQAILDAPPGETINVPAGTYTLTSKQLTVEKSLTISGHAASDTIISGGGAFRVIGVGGAGNSVTISGVTIRDGHDNQPGGIAAGAGIGNDEANLTLRNVVVTNNHADASNPAGPGGIAEGGGVASAGGSLTIEGSAITNNSATAAGGAEKNGPGGIAEGGGLASFGGASLTIRDTNISGNVADVRGGGAKGPGGIVEGGGAFLEIEPTTAVAISNDTVSANVADASAGAEGPGGIVEAGGLFLDLSQGQVTASNLTIAGNSAHAPGGSAGGIVEGGGLLVETGKGATLTLISATIAGNSADAAGGIVEGGNIEPDPGTKIANSIVSGGSGGSTGDCAEKLESLGFNLESADQCGFTAGGDQVNKDPLLGPLQNNGGPAPTMVPAANSPAVDQGAPFGLTTDERGVVRPIDFPTIPNSAAAGANGSDVGAAELQPSNAFTVGKLKKNKKKGIATLTVDLPQPSLGTLTLHGKGLKTQTVAIAGQAELKLKVQGTKKVKKALRKHGKRKVTIEVTYAPTGNSPATQALKAKLVLKHKKHKKHGKKRH